MLSVDDINEMQKTIERKDRIIKVLKERVRQWVKEYNILDAIIDLKDEYNEELQVENKLLKDTIKNKNLGLLAEENEKLRNTLQQIKAIAEAPKPFIDFSVTKTATEVEYDYAAICNELELRLHRVLDLITKAEEE